MGKVIDLRAKVEDNLPHEVSEVICVRCGNRWIAVRPEKTLLKELQCSKCFLQGFVIETDESLEKLGGDLV